MPPLADPQFLGLVRFGAGPNCPCAQRSWRLIRSLKYWHGWDWWERPRVPVHHLIKTLDGPLFGDDAGSWAIDPFTGLSSGAYLNIEGDPRFPVFEFTDYTSVHYGTGHPDDGAGTASLSQPYRLAAVQSHAFAAFARLHPLEVAPHTYHELYRAEVFRSPTLLSGHTLQAERFLQLNGGPSAFGLLAIDGGILHRPADLRFSGSIILGDTGAPDVYQIWTTAYVAACVAHRLYLEGHLGYWSMSDAIRFGAINGVSPRPSDLIEDLGTRWFFHLGGPLDILSPRIPDRHEPSDIQQVYGVRTIRLGLAPPPGTEVTETGAGVPGGSGDSTGLLC